MELGGQEESFPFGTPLVLSEPEIIRSSGFSNDTYHDATCGSLSLRYSRIADTNDILRMLETAVGSMKSALVDGSFTQAEAGWAELLLTYLAAPMDDWLSLPKSPAEPEQRQKRNGICRSFLSLNQEDKVPF